MAGFDVLTEPWIPVIALDGSQRELGIIDALADAHKLFEVICESPLETYAVQRFLITFLMDAYRLSHAGDRRRLFESKCFDKNVIKKYVALCRSEGVTFDLFDKEKPFYQAVFDESMIQKLKSSHRQFYFMLYLPVIHRCILIISALVNAALLKLFVRCWQHRYMPLQWHKDTLHL